MPDINNKDAERIVKNFADDPVFADAVAPCACETAGQRLAVPARIAGNRNTDGHVFDNPFHRLSIQLFQTASGCFGVFNFSDQIPPSAPPL